MVKLPQLLPKYRKFSALRRRDKFLFLEALALQVLVGLVLKIIPFRLIPNVFKNPSAPIRVLSLPDLSQIRAATVRASTISPWKNKCLVQSLAARKMLSRRRITSRISLGLMHSSQQKVIAHAWLTVDDFEIVPKAGEYVELKCF